MASKIAFRIFGTKQRKAGFVTLANYGIFGDKYQTSDFDRNPLINENPVYVLIHTDDYIYYLLIDRSVKSYDADADGALSVLLAIDSGEQLKYGKSPYTLLNEIYEKFKELYMEQQSDGRFQFKNIDIYDCNPFVDIINANPTEPTFRKVVVMNPAGNTGILSVPEDKREEFFADTQYPEFANVKDVEIGVKCNSSKAFATVRISKEQTKRATVVVHTTNTGSDVSVREEAPKSSDTDKPTKPSVDDNLFKGDLKNVNERKGIFRKLKNLFIGIGIGIVVGGIVGFLLGGGMDNAANGKQQASAADSVLNAMRQDIRKLKATNDSLRLLNEIPRYNAEVDIDYFSLSKNPKEAEFIAAINKKDFVSAYNVTGTRWSMAHLCWVIFHYNETEGKNFNNLDELTKLIGTIDKDYLEGIINNDPKQKGSNTHSNTGGTTTRQQPQQPQKTAEQKMDEFVAAFNSYQGTLGKDAIQKMSTYKALDSDWKQKVDRHLSGRALNQLLNQKGSLTKAYFN